MYLVKDGVLYAAFIDLKHIIGLIGQLFQTFIGILPQHI